MSAGGFAWRGVVEGYYGTPWTDEDRLWWIDRLGAWGMNLLVHAPKDDPLQRAHWREPYPAQRMAAFARWIERGARAGVGIGFGLSPGLSIAYASAADQAELRGKAQAFAERGARFLALCLDDVPFALAHGGDRERFASLAEAHAETAHGLRHALGDDVTLWLVPTDYGGIEGSDYLAELGERLADGIEVAWTGPAVLSRSIPVAQAAARARLLRRRLLLWDNVPVSDGPMRGMLHLAPWVGRSPALAAHCSGVLLNPMQHARSSAPTVASAAASLAGGDAERAWEAAVRELGAGAEEAFLRFAGAHRLSPMSPEDRDAELEGALRALQECAHDRDRRGGRLAALRDRVAAREAVLEDLESHLLDRRLWSEIELWARAHHAESRRMAIVLEALAAAWSDAPALDRCLAWVRAEGRLTRSPPSHLTSYGPRRVFYPQLTSQQPEAARFGGGPTLLRDRCLADEVVRFAERAVLEALGSPGRTEPA